MSVRFIVSYNVNGIRAAQRKGLEDWLEQANPDVLCVQETKAHPEQVDTKQLRKLGYVYQYWENAEKKGYSGVAVFSKIKPLDITNGMGIERYDNEGRVLQIDFGDVRLINTYIPSGTTGDERQALKMRFLDSYFDFIQSLRSQKDNLLVMGDYNICHQAIDIHDPVRNANTSGFKPEERAWMSKYFDAGMVDTFRHFNKEPHQYSWWTYRANARANNKGWRIDYIAASPELQSRLDSAGIMSEVVHSDHCPVYVKLKS